MPKAGARRKRGDSPLRMESAGPSSAMDDSSSGGEESDLRSPPRSLKKTTSGAVEVWKEEKVIAKVPRGKCGVVKGDATLKMGEVGEKSGEKSGQKLGPAGKHLEKLRKSLNASQDILKVAGKSVEKNAVAKHVATLKSITAKFSEEIFQTEGMTMTGAQKLLKYPADYEEFAMVLITEIAHLRGQVDAAFKINQRSAGGATTTTPTGTRAMPAPLAPAPVLPTPVLPAAPTPKPVETWSVVVRGKAPISSKEVITKVVKEVGPSLGVRVHEVRPLRDGGAIIRTPSVAEREKLAKNAKFSEVGLDVSVRPKMGTRVVVQGVHTEISPDEFMGELFRLNLRELSPGCLEKDVRMVGRPWKVGPDGVTNVVLEGTDKLMSALLEAGRCYIKWFSFRVRPDRLTPGCFRCMGFDHRVAECRAKQDVCRRCGQEGHRSAGCSSAPHCRNCAFKGKAAGHLMMSADCPIYSGIVARALVRH